MPERSETVTISDCRAAGYCVAGVRRHAALLGLDFRRFVREGVPISEIETIDDQAVQRIVAVARKRLEQDNG